MVYKSLNGKYMILIFATLFMLITSCATTPREQPIDLNGWWLLTDHWKGCRDEQVESWTVYVSQKGNKIKLTNEERNITSYGILTGNTIAMKEYSYRSRAGGISIIHDYNYILSEDRKTLKGTKKWSYAMYKGGPILCTGTTKAKMVIMVRNSKK